MYRADSAYPRQLPACVYLRYSRTNLACAVLTPIKLVSRGHIAQLSRLVASSGEACHCPKSDHGAAYKQLPVGWSQSKLAAIALRNPRDKQRYGLLTRAMVFGAVAAVLRYNALSRIAEDLASKISGIPVAFFFGDFGDLIPGTSDQEDLAIFSRFFQLLGIPPKAAESRVGERVVFPGLEGGFALAGKLHGDFRPVNS